MSAQAAILAVGIGITLLSQSREAKQKAEAEREDAFLRDLQAIQVEKSAERDVRLLRTRGQKIKGEQIGAIAASGIELSGTPLQLIEDTAFAVESEISAIREGARFRASQIRAGAEARRRRAEDIEGAVGLRQLGTILGGSSRIAAASGKLG